MRVSFRVQRTLGIKVEADSGGLERRELPGILGVQSLFKDRKL